MTNEEAIKIITRVMNSYHVDTMINRGIDDALSMAIQALKAEPIKHERWEKALETPETMELIYIYGRYICSHCGNIEKTQTNYCPNCGARMDGGENE